MTRSRIFVAAVLAIGTMAAVGCVPGAPSGPWLAAGCYDSPVADAPDFFFTGSPNNAGNLRVRLDIATFTLSTNGSCAGIELGAPYTFTLVRAADQAAADTACSTLGLDDGAGPIGQDYPAIPADGWVCNPPVTT